MSQADLLSSPIDASVYQYIVGIQIGSQTFSCCALKPDKSQVIKPSEFPNAMPGFTFLQERLEALDVELAQILIGLEATSRDARKSLSLSRKSRIFPLPAPSATNPSVCATMRTPSENGQIGCRYHCNDAQETGRLVGAICQLSVSPPTANWCAYIPSESR